MPDPSPAYYTAAALATVVLIYKLFWARPAKGLRWGVYTMLLAGACLEFFAAPATIGVVNRITGIPNVSTVLVYSLVLIVGLVQLLLIIYWQRPLQEARLLARPWVVLYVLAVLVLIALFIIGADRVPEERRVDFDTYYATTPVISAFILLYLIGFSISAFAVSWIGFRWAKVAGRPWLRRGLRCIGASQSFALAFVVAKVTAVVARMAGNDLDFLSSRIAPLCGTVAVALYAIGWMVPAYGERISHLIGRIRRWRDYRALYRLWRELTEAEPRVLQQGKLPLFGLEERITRRCREIRDAELALRTRFDPDIDQIAIRVADAAGAKDRDHDCMVDAIRLRAAIHAKTKNQRFREPAPQEAHHDGVHGLNELEYLAKVARLFRTSTTQAIARRELTARSSPSTEAGRPHSGAPAETVEREKG